MNRCEIFDIFKTEWLNLNQGSHVMNAVHMKNYNFALEGKTFLSIFLSRIRFFSKFSSNQALSGLSYNKASLIYIRALSDCYLVLFV
jgi:hypothetical protein